MNICGEHGDEIAFAGRDCPACDQIEEINSDFKEKIATREDDLQSDINDMQDTIDELQDKLDAK